MQCAIHPFWRVPNWFSVSFMNSNTAKAHFGSWFLNTSEIISETSSKLISEIISETISKHLSKFIRFSLNANYVGHDKQVALFLFWLEPGGFNVSFFLVLIQRNTFWLPIRFLFMFPKLFPELFPELFPRLFPKIFPKLSPNLLPKLLPNLFPKFCQHQLFFFHEFY